jgi:hypothetical protein
MDDRPTAASPPGTTPPRATVEASGLVAVLEALALAAPSLDGTKRSAADVDDQPRPGDNS